MYYIGLDAHEKTISYCVKDASSHRAERYRVCCRSSLLQFRPLFAVKGNAMFATERHIAACVGTLLLLIAICVPCAQAAGGHDLSGFYSVSNVVALGNSVQATVHVRLVNHRGATITLQNPILRYRTPLPQTTQRLSNITLPPQKVTEFTQQVTVDAREYREWTKRAPFSLSFLSNSASGEAAGRSLALRPLHPAPLSQTQPQARQTGGQRP
jgi:hypothetical protein